MKYFQNSMQEFCKVNGGGMGRQRCSNKFGGKKN